ncbi:unnamed protein product [Citrullus colocynthis]|uniref:Uncharacterized protein n=1 Tax=Citrullus colocynthis TaxID=252529 RepID=A0ABP0YVE6_9ROSI
MNLETSTKALRYHGMLRGFGRRDKRRLVREVIPQENPSIVILVGNCCKQLMKSSWRKKENGVAMFVHGIIMMWDISVAESLDVDEGIYSISSLAFSLERLRDR